jgi:hypothetical protein
MWADRLGQDWARRDGKPMNFGMIWDSQDKPDVEDAIAQVRERAAIDGTVIPDGIEPTITRNDPSVDSKYGSLHVIFEWDEPT